jgi:hypothetical protein
MGQRLRRLFFLKIVAIKSSKQIENYQQKNVEAIIIYEYKNCWGINNWARQRKTNVSWLLLFESRIQRVLTVGVCQWTKVTSSFFSGSICCFDFLMDS